MVRKLSAMTVIKRQAWNTTLFVRSVVEIVGYAETIRACQEAVDFVSGSEYNIPP